MAEIADSSKILIQLRVSPEERDELKDAGRLFGRSLPNEILYRLGEYRRGSPGGIDRAIGDLAVVIARRAASTLSDLFGAPPFPTLRNVSIGLPRDFFDPKVITDDVSPPTPDFADLRDFSGEFKGFRRDFADPKVAARRSEILALTRDAMVKVFDDLGAASAVPTSAVADAVEVTWPEIVTSITFDLAKKIRAPRENDDTPEGRVLARVGKALGVQQKEASHE